MSTPKSPSSNYDGPRIDPPLVSAAETNPANYARGRFDDDLGMFVKEQAKRRSPTEETNWRHAVGFAGELVTAAYFEKSADWSIKPDYEGDDGYDLVVNGNRIEVKTVSRYDDLQLRVPHNQLSTSDYFVLGRSTEPTDGAELIGWVSRRELLEWGHSFTNQEIIRLNPSHLHTFRPIRRTPNEIRQMNTHD